MVEETQQPGVTLSDVARARGVSPSLLLHWRKLAGAGALTGGRSNEAVVPAWEYQALQAQVTELQRLLGTKTLENEILKKALGFARIKR
jgi:transposase